MAENIGKAFRNSIKKNNQLFISCNLAFFQKRWHRTKTKTDQCWQKDVLNSKFNLEWKCEVKMGHFHLKKTSVFPEVSPFWKYFIWTGAVDYSRLPIFILIRFWESRKFLTNGLRDSACISSRVRTIVIALLFPKFLDVIRSYFCEQFVFDVWIQTISAQRMIRKTKNRQVER
jgi:hypothetical protein